MPVDGARSTARRPSSAGSSSSSSPPSLGGKVGQNDIDDSASGNGESKRGDMLIEAAGFPEQAGEQVLIQGKGAIKAGDPK